jgi:tetratricopeptide (TPR) repeat protein
MAALLVFVAVVAVYLQTLGGPFVWDDRLLVLDASLVEQGGSLGDYFRSPFWSGGTLHGADTNYYRPLVTLSFALDRALHHDNAGGYHLTNALLHVANSLLVYALLRRHGARDAVAALLSVAWALQPRLAEAAAWISGRTDLLASLFTLGALLAVGPSAGRRILAALLVGVGLLAKESAAAGVLALAAGSFATHAALPLRARVARTLVELAPLGAVLGAYGGLRLATVGLGDDVETLGAFGRVRAVIEALGTYAAMLLDPFRPRAIIGRPSARSVAALCAGLAVVALLVALVRRRPRLGVGSATGVALAAGALVPVLHVVPIPLLTLAADRFLYLPTAGLALAGAPALDRFLRLGRARWAGALAGVLALSVATFGRVSVWSDELEFWIVTYLETPPTNHAAANELSNVYYRAGLFEDALFLAERSLTYDDPRRDSAAYNAAVSLVRLGRYAEARERLAALRGKRRVANRVDFQLAILEIRTGRFDAARALLEPLAQSDGTDARNLLSHLGDFARARREFERLGPASPPEQRAALADVVGDDALAERSWREAVESPSVPRPVARRGLEYLLQRGDRRALARAALAYERRFGGIEPGLASMIGVRLAELERLEAARDRIGIPAPKIPRESAALLR